MNPELAVLLVGLLVSGMVVFGVFEVGRLELGRQAGEDGSRDVSPNRRT